METLAQIYAQIPRDRNGYQFSDKADVHSYIEVYEELFRPHRRPGVSLLEIGLFHGASLRAWERYFAEGEIWGIDSSERPHDAMADLRPMIAEGTHNIIIGDATDANAVPRMAFDIIIDDAAHNVPQQLALYAAHRERLKKDGLYIIEDIENLDRDRTVFETIDPMRKVEILDRRHIKNRFDDVLVIIRG